MVRARVKQVLNRWPALKAAAFLLNDLWWGVRLHFGQIETSSGTTHSTISIEDSLRYIEEVFRDYKDYGELASFRGVVAEVGPGDNAGVAVLMRKDGSDQVDLIGRYFSRCDTQKQSMIYDALSKRHRLDWLRCELAWNDTHLVGITQQVGQSAEEFFVTVRKAGDLCTTSLSRDLCSNISTIHSTHLNPWFLASSRVGR